VGTDDTALALADDIADRLRALADPSLVDGIVESRSPGKPVLGIRIPPLRAAVRSGLKEARLGRDEDLANAAEQLWFAQFHEEELAACMILRLTRTPCSPGLVARWAVNLDNWLSVDELGGWVGEAVAAGHLEPRHLAPLAGADSPWQRRLYVVSLIPALRGDLDPAAVPELVELLHDTDKPVRMAVAWLIKSVLKGRPQASALFLAAADRPLPAPVRRLLDRVPA
jgi:3-methyladenine DNA glycosylase AlkD